MGKFGVDPVARLGKVVVVRPSLVLDAVQEVLPLDTRAIGQAANTIQARRPFKITGLLREERDPVRIVDDWDLDDIVDEVAGSGHRVAVSEGSDRELDRHERLLLPAVEEQSRPDRRLPTAGGAGSPWGRRMSRITSSPTRRRRKS
jgi:hypothetical protein